jgi:formylglycine-generating enzyme required for sulfatase activity
MDKVTNTVNNWNLIILRLTLNITSYRFYRIFCYLGFLVLSLCGPSACSFLNSLDCGPPDPKSRPGWTREPPDCDEEFCYFLGVSEEKHEGEFSSWDYARISAMNKAVRYIGLQFEFDDKLLTKVENQKTSQVIDPTINWETYQTQKARALIRSVKSRSRYTELSLECVDGGKKKRFYKTFELIKIGKSALKEAEEWQKNNQIHQYVVQANQLEADANYTHAILKLRQAEMELKLLPKTAMQSWINVIERSMARIEIEAEEQVFEARNLHELAQERRLEGNVVECLELLNRAKSILRRVQFILTEGKVISLNTLNAEEESIANSLVLRALNRDDYVVEPFQPIPDYSLQVILRENKTNIPVKNLPILFTLYTRQKSKSIVLTDSDGRVRFTPPVIEETGKYQISAAPGNERLEGTISPQAAGLLSKIQIQFELVVKTRTDEERAELVVAQLKNQLNRQQNTGEEFHLFIGNIRHKHRVCEIPQLQKMQTLIRNQFEIQTSFTIHNKIDIPYSLSSSVDPSKIANLSKALGINILSFQFHQKSNHLTFKADIYGPEGVVAQSSVWLRNHAIDEKIIDDKCYIPKLAQWIDPVTKMSFRLIKGGCFNMGGKSYVSDENEKPVHEVCLKDYYLGTHEVTQDQWQMVMGNNPSRWKTGGSYPVERVNWNAVMEFVQTLNKQSDVRFDLPSEAEWEYACRGGNGLHAEFGTQSGTINRGEANFGLDSGFGPDPADEYMHTAPTGKYPQNKIDLYDMSGNVMEWVKDFYFPNGYLLHDKNDPVVLSHNKTMVLRGGSFNTGWKWLRCGKRYHSPPGKRMIDTGFRLKMTK